MITMSADNTYTFPPFETDPPGCFISYVYDIPVEAAVVVDSFVNTKFTFLYYDSLSPVGVHTISVTGQTGFTTARQTTATFTLTIEDPCLTDLISIDSLPLYDGQLPPDYRLF